MRLYWNNHGTKFYGALVMLAGASGEALVYIQQLDPKHAAVWGVIITLGAGIIRQGFVNSQRQEDSDEHPDPRDS